MQRPKAILFDLGNVLFEIDIPGCSQRIYDLLAEDVDKKQFRASFRIKNEEFETGELSKGAFINFILRHSKKKVQALDAILAWNSMLVGMPVAHVEMLNQLRKKMNIYLLSNINALHLKRYREMIVEDWKIDDFDSLFQQCFYSCEIEKRKPNPECFEHVLDHLPFDAEEVLFLDDTLDNIETAQGLGFEAIHIPSIGETQKVVARMGLLDR